MRTGLSSDDVTPYQQNSPVEYEWPIESGIISSVYGDRPDVGTGSFHGGIDISAPVGTRVNAAADGSVVVAVNHEKYGNMVVVQHDDGSWSVDMHLNEYDVEVGDEVNAGDQIGSVGNTGSFSQGPHLHHSEIPATNKLPDFANGKTMVVRNTQNPLDLFPDEFPTGIDIDENAVEALPCGKLVNK